MQRQGYFCVSPKPPPSNAPLEPSPFNHSDGDGVNIAVQVLIDRVGNNFSEVDIVENICEEY